jgi:hypothetical protein
MAEAFQFGFGNPDNFSDWAKYAGLDRKTGTISALDLGQQQGVAPPENFSEFVQQKAIDPFNQKIDSLKQQGANFAGAMDQFGQGNFVKGMNTARGMYPAQQATQTVAPTTHWQLGHDID